MQTTRPEGLLPIVTKPCLHTLQDAVSEARGSERTAVAREAEAEAALCKENTALKQQLRSLQQDCGRSRGACHAVTAELAEVKDAFRQVRDPTSLRMEPHLPASCQQKE